MKSLVTFACGIVAGIRYRHDPEGRLCEAKYVGERDPSFVTYGPKTRRAFFALRREQGMRP